MTKSNRIYCMSPEEAATTDQVLEKLVKKRLKLKDQIVGMRLRIERRMGVTIKAEVTSHHKDRTERRKFARGSR